MAEKKHIVIVCGEASGDLNASLLIRSLKAINPQVKISGVGGSMMREAGAEIYQDIKELSAIGLFDVLKKLPRFFALKKLLLEKINSQKPDAVVLIDFSGFNLRLAKAINKKIPVIYYISPQIWASRQGRVNTIKQYISKMIVVFRFEEEFYRKFGIDAEFVGHPLLEIVRAEMNKAEFLMKFSLAPGKTTIALLPGSRKQEIKNILPIMLKTASLIKRELHDIQFIIAKPAQTEWDIYNRLVAGTNLDIRIIEGSAYDCLNSADFALVASGTATLETALMQKPFAIIYKMDFLNYLLYRPQVKLPYIGMVNIVAEKKIVPEFIQFQAVPEEIAKYALQILTNPAEAKKIQSNLRDIRLLLGETGAARRAAQAILDFIDRQ